MNRVLVVDDEVEVTSFFQYFLEDKGCEVTVANSGRDVDQLLQSPEACFHLALVDLKLPDANGLDLLSKIKNRQPTCEVLIMTGYSTVKTAVLAIQAGARDYLEKPFDNLESLGGIIQSLLQRSVGKEDLFNHMAASYGIVYTPGSEMEKLLTIADKLAKKAINVLIEGETGTGKELFARFIHGVSLRASHPFVGINCGAVSESLLESELFGHEKGAFSGAVKTRKGYFELAHNGTLFLDEIGEAPPSIQVKLLRAIETGEFMRVGSEETIKSNVRFISATNRNLELETEQNRFRADLLYRLEGVKLTIPPLRNRREDIAVIANHYLEKKFGGACRLDPETVEILKRYDWPGNVRQLLNVLNQTHSIHECHTLKPDKLPPWLIQKAVANKEETSLQKQLESFLESEIRLFVENITNGIATVDHIDFPSLMKRIKKIEGEIGRRIIQKGLSETAGNRQLLSHKLRITERTLRYILNEK
ncbi:sigma-54-dependent transcriptional regulator [Effusibacillus dendaii]|uniref:Acetoacetate metabolism regulatory protein AtoC n=1 Tax=Effusibacillus dendaii TaxID=2743772 RepID=A0A7I8DHP1_9BACL|nr:sigma-54 dependent transcriptional regulator [Effusibacillus dendaii]BCJ88436.1 acetoacetate metabolism regulatory protein AtoC [Effusibacillus dendaii]